MIETSISEAVQDCLDKLRGGDKSVLNALYTLVNDRLVLLTRKMKNVGYRSITDGGLEQTEDITQNMAVRLLRALEEVVPLTARDFYGFVNLQIRRELLDTIRKHKGRDGMRRALGPIPDGMDVTCNTHDPVNLQLWEDFHEYVDSLDSSEQEIVGLMWYQGLTLNEAGTILGEDKHKVRERWRKVQKKLATLFAPPGTSYGVKT